MGQRLHTETVDGELYVWSRPAMPHARALSRLGMIIGSAFDLGRSGRDGWWIVSQPEIHFGPNLIVPDVAGWRRASVPVYAEDGGIPPHWVAEILSPSTARVDRVKKLPIYANAEVPWVWIIDPVEQTLEVKRLTNGQYVDAALHGGDEKVRIDPFAELEIDLTLFWGSPPPL